MKGASGDEQENDFVASNNVNPKLSKSQYERAEQLRRMMEDEGRNTSASKGVSAL